MTTSLSHTPSYTVTHPDTFTDDTTGHTFEVRQDTDAEDPRSWIDPEHVAIWAFNEPPLSHSVAAEKPEGNIAIDAFAHFYEVFDSDHALQATRRWLTIFHPDEKIEIDTQTIRGYSQGDWLDVVCAVEDGYGTPESHIKVFRQWAFGDVYVVSSDYGGPMGGIYADSMEEAITQYRKNFPVPPTDVDEETEQSIVVERDLHLRITAVDTNDVEAKIAWIIEALDDSDALPTGVKASTEPFNVHTKVIDELAHIVQNSVSDAKATRADWQSTLDQVFGNPALEPLAVQPHPADYFVTWEINQDGKTPAEAAAAVWQQIFRRGHLQPSADEACIFTVTEGDRSVLIDLSEERFAHLFA